MKTVDLETLDSSPGRHAQEQSWVARGEKRGGCMCSGGELALLGAGPWHWRRQFLAVRVCPVVAGLLVQLTPPPLHPKC